MGTTLWQLIDHCRWLQTMQFMRGNPKRTNCLSFSFFTLGQLAGVIHWLPLMFYTKNASDSPQMDETKKCAAIKARVMGFKNFLNAISFAHISNLCISHDILCGANAVIVGSMDIYDNYPRLQAPKPKKLLTKSA
jgi:hypothetical protein